MSELVITPNRNGHVCGDCEHWLASEAVPQVMVLGPGGMQAMRISDFTRAGKPLPEDGRTAVMGPCTIGPFWQMVPKHHWCGGFCAKVKS